MTPAETVIQTFGGIRATARAIGKAPSTVHQWKEKGFIPGELIAHVLEIAKQHRLKLTIYDIVYGRPHRKR